ncbi:MAG: CDGSH iron-sulfur domain-containing protein [Acidimicrobiales bacterium]
MAAQREASFRIKITANGPYLVSGGAPLARRRVVASEHGEPMAWQTTAELETPERFALCRCGGSLNKPFCDGTHARSGFDGTESAPTTTYDERAKSYPTDHVVVRDDRQICEHAGFCGNRATNVWKMLASHDTDDSITRAQMMAMIERCPSGALTFRMSPEGGDVEPALMAGIGVVENGPYFVTGGVAIERSDGAAFETRNRMTLCRCGSSKNKPLCDGTHKEIGFSDS